MTIIRCDWPATELRPNFTRDNHWRKWRSKNTAYRHLCATLARAQSVHMRKWPEGDIRLSYEFYPPKGCRWDDDAMEGAFKAGQDGIADAMRVDDKHFRVTKTIKPRYGAGCVLVQILTEPVQCSPYEQDTA